ncbi:MAG: hypothetical protein AAF267_25035 [Deinococcota bacterium]
MNYLEVNDNARERVNDMVQRGEQSFRFRHLTQPTLIEQLSTLFRNFGAKLTPINQHPRGFRRQAKKA